MPKFKIPVTFEMYGTLTIETDTLEEAIKFAIEDSELPETKFYVDGSLSINEEMLEHLNPKINISFGIKED